jgi:nucleoprotein TPR
LHDSRVQTSNSELLAKFSNLEVESKLKESEALPLYHEKQRLQKELEDLQAHSRWLEQEVDARRNDYQRVLQDSRDRQMQLQTQLQMNESAKIETETKNAELEKIQTRLQEQVEKLTLDITRKTQEMIHLQETTELEVQQERKLIQQQQDQIGRWEQKVNDLVRENESLKAAAKEASQMMEQNIQTIQDDLKEKYDELLRNQAKEYESRLAQAPVAIAPFAASEEKTDDLSEFSVSDLVERLELTKAALREAKSRAEKAEGLNKRLYAEIENKTPMFVRQKQEFDYAMEQNEILQRRLGEVISDKESVQEELDYARKERDRIASLLKSNEDETKYLAGQVQTLLASRAGSDGTVQGIPISVEEMQQENQRLYSEKRKLEIDVRQLKEQLQTDELRAKVNELEQELEEMTSEKMKQEDQVLKILQQRDIYRSLCNLDDPSAEGRSITIEEVSRKQADKTKEMEARIKVLKSEKISLEAENDRLSRDKEVLEERLLRTETNRTEISVSLQTLENELTKAKGESAWQKADAEYYKKKLERTEESYRRSADECIALRSARSELQRINEELQQVLSEEKDRVNVTNTHKEQAETKVRQAVAETEMARAAERRLASENADLKREVARQGSIIESIQRIESSLSARSTTELESLKVENSRLMEQLASERKRLETENENLKERVNEGETKIAEAGRLKSKAETEMLEAKKSLLASEAEKRAISLKSENLESKLRAANKKLGISDDSDHADVSLQARVDELSTDIEKYKNEISSLNESVDSYKKVAREAEKSYKDLSLATEELKKKIERDAQEKDKEMEILRTESSKRQDMIVELTRDLSSQQDEAQKRENKLQGEVSLLQAKVDSLERDVESTKASAAAATMDLDSLRSDLSATQDNYERELKLHAEARSQLRFLREQSDEASRKGREAEEKIASLNQSLLFEQERVEKINNELTSTTQTLEKRLEASQAQNRVLHEQLDTLNQMVETLKSNRVTAAIGGGFDDSSDVHGLQKQISELQEVVRFLRSDNEMIQTQLDTAKRTVEREKAAGNVLASSLEEARSELKELRDAAGNSESDATKKLKETESKLSETKDQLKLLRDSNHVLREQSEKAESMMSQMKREIESLKEAAKPLEKASHDASVRIAQLEAEKASLSNDVASWKSRVESLVTKFNQIDPEEHRKALKRVGELEAEKETLEKWKTTTEQENTRIRDIARRLKDSKDTITKTVELQKKEIERLEEEKTNLLKATSESSALTTERDSLKERLLKLEKQFESSKTELDGANTMNGRLRERLRQFQTQIKELKASAGASGGVTGATSSIPTKQSTKLEVPAEKGISKSPAPSLKHETTKKPPEVPEGGFKYGPSSAGDDSAKETTSGIAGASKESAASSLRADAPSFAPPSLVPKTMPPVTSEKVESSSPSEKSPPKVGSSVTKEQSMKEKLLERKLLLEKKRKLAELKKKAKAGSTDEKITKADTEEQQAAKKARTSELEPATAGNRKSLEDQDTAPAPGAAAADPVQEDGQEEVGTEGTDTNQDNEVAVDSASGTSASLSTPFGSLPGTQTTMTFGKSTPSLGSSPAFGTTSTFGGGVPSSNLFQNSQSGALNSLTPAAAPMTQSTSSFGSSFLNMKPPGSGTAPTLSFTSSSGSITLPTPSLTAPAPSPFGGFSGSGFGSGTTFGSSFGSSNPPSFGSRPLFGTSEQQEEAEGKNTNETEAEGDQQEAKEEGETQDD